MGAIVLACGNAGIDGGSPLFAERDVLIRTMPERPGKAEVDPVLAELDGRRLVVHGSDAALNAVVLRLLRTEALVEVPVAFLPADERSAVAAVWGLPADFGRAADLALDGDADRVPLIRDDNGGVLVGRGVLGPVRGVGYCDDEQVLRGQAARIVVTPDLVGGLLVRVVRRTVLGKRTKAANGRAFQVGSLPVKPTYDGVRHPRPVNRWSWYRHTEDLRLVRGL